MEQLILGDKSQNLLIPDNCFLSKEEGNQELTTTKDTSNVASSKGSIIKAKVCKIEKKGRSRSFSDGNVVLHEKNEKDNSIKINFQKEYFDKVYQNEYEAKEKFSNPQMVKCYLLDILKYNLDNELKNINDVNYFESVQDDVKEKMRAILFDWLVGVHLKLKMQKLET